MSRTGVIRVAFRGTMGRFALDAAFEVPATGVTALFGPSGCGKTTVLRCMAGLQRFGDGLCIVDGDVWQKGSAFEPTYKRPLGYVFQEASLFPHLSVKGNLLYGAPSRRAMNEGSDSRLGEIHFGDVVSLLGLSHLLDRSPRHLSGGERQRVAIGRALLSQPRLLLMDEPLSALDGTTRGEILPFLERLHASLALPIIYVSHDMSEVERLADTLVAMRAGRVEAVGPLEVLQSDPSLPFALARDAAVTIDAVVESYDAAYGLTTLRVRDTGFLVPGQSAAPGNRQRLRVAAGDVSIARAASQLSTILNVLPVEIASVTPAGEHEMLAVLNLYPDGPRLLARVTRRSWQGLELKAGEQVFAQIKSVALARNPPA